VHFLADEWLAALVVILLYRGHTPYSDSISTGLKSLNNIKVFVYIVVSLLFSDEIFAS
jgi:hypothetical protein